MVETLHGRGYDIKIFDPYVSIASIRGANRDYIVHAIPHIHKMLTTDFQEFLEHAQTVVIGNQSPLFRGLLKRSGGDRRIIDLVNLMSRRGRRAAVTVNSASKAPETVQAVCV
jgi:GDP-mannose 6-dehydrogenase